MNRVSLPIGGLLALSTMLVAGSCADNQWSIIIRQNQAPETGCVVSGDLQSAYRPSGVLDIGDFGTDVNIGYVFTPVVSSGLRANINQPNDNIVIIEGAHVTLRSDGSELSNQAITALEGQSLTRRDHKTSGSIDPQGSLGMLFFAIDDGQAVALRDVVEPDAAVQLIASVSVYGYVDGSSVESPEFDYPITVCEGCLVSNFGDCSALPTSFQGSPGGECNPFQDVPLGCCTVSGSSVCPAIGTMTGP
jgi:hypothetical protein